MRTDLIGNQRARKHGWFGTPEYQAWADMHRRCTGTHRDNFHNYGGRGIRVCRQWRSFEAFIASVGARPSAQHSLERIDNARNYTPANVRWATPTEQARNRRQNTWYTHNGVRRCLIEWAEHSGIPADTLSWRLKAGWSFARAITAPRRQQRNNR